MEAVQPCGVGRSDDVLVWLDYNVGDRRRRRRARRLQPAGKSRKATVVWFRMAGAGRLDRSHRLSAQRLLHPMRARLTFVRACMRHSLLLSLVLAGLGPVCAGG